VAPEKSAQALIEGIVQREGGFVNNPNDAGGATKYGITIATLAAWRGSPVSVEDVRNLTVAEAAAIYEKRYIVDPGLDSVLDPQLRELLVDFGVLSGPKRAVMGLQKALGFSDAECDGMFGPKSRAALAAVTNIKALFYAVKCERLEQLLRICANPTQSVFANGWANRLDHFDYKD
jgi:lysozyme family protein